MNDTANAGFASAGAQPNFVYASEADLLNVALFGVTAKECSRYPHEVVTCKQFNNKET